MRVAKIKITNILGIEELEIDPGAITVLEGRNGVGKTSTIEAIRSVVEGGHDGTLLRNGADVGEVVLVLDDETVIRKRITAGGSTLTVRRPDVGDVRAPQTYLAKLADALSVNPIAFLTADPKGQAEYLLESLPLMLDEGDVVEAVGGTVPVEAGDLAGHALAMLDRLRKRIYDERTGVNRAAKEKKATVGQLGESVPEVVVSEASLRERLKDLQRENETLQAEGRARAEEITRKRDNAIAEIKAEAQHRIDEARTQAETERTAALEGALPRIQELAALIAAGDTELREADRHANTRQVVAGLEKDVADLEARSQGLTDALSRLDGLRARLLSKLPIPGLELVDGVIHKGGVPFSRINRAEQVKVAIALARLRAGELKLICIDGIECLDGPTFEAFKVNAARTGLQFVVTRVNPDPAAEGMGMSVVASTAAVA